MVKLHLESPERGLRLLTAPGRFNSRCPIGTRRYNCPLLYYYRVLCTYPEIRDRIYKLARERQLRVDWVESTRSSRVLLLHDREQIVVARALVRVKNITQWDLDELQADLAHVFGKDWLA